MVPIVFNPNVIEPILLIGFMVAGGGFYSYYKLKCIKLDKARNIVRKLSVLWIQKTFNTILKMGSIPYWVQFHANREKYLHILLMTNKGLKEN